MHHKTEGIVLGTSRYSDVYSITHVFTRDFGRVSYLLPRSGKKSNVKTSLFFPLSIVSLSVEHQPLREIQRIKEAERLTPLHEICTDMAKVSVAFFLSEFLSRVLRETHDNELLFHYIKNSIETLEQTHQGIANFHMAFMLGLTRFLGFYPNLEAYRPGLYFDLMNGEFVAPQPLHPHYLNKTESAVLLNLQRMDYATMRFFKFSRSDRNLVIERLLTYYRLHVYDFLPLKSLDVLKELF